MSSSFTPGFYARIKFIDEHDQRVDTVPCSIIEQFTKVLPVDEENFDSKFIYTCLWTDDKNPDIVKVPILIGALKDCENDDDLTEFKNKRSSFPSTKKLSNSLRKEYYADSRQTDTDKESEKIKEDKKTFERKNSESNRMLQMTILEKKKMSMIHDEEIVNRGDKTCENNPASTKSVSIVLQDIDAMYNDGKGDHIERGKHINDTIERHEESSAIEYDYLNDDVHNDLHNDSKEQYSHSIESNLEKIQQLEERIETLKTKYTTLKKTRKNLTKENKDLMETNESLNEEIKGLMETNESLKKKYDELLKKNKIIKEKLDTLRDLNETMQKKMFKKEPFVEITDKSNNQEKDLKSEEFHCVSHRMVTSTPAGRSRSLESAKKKIHKDDEDISGDEDSAHKCESNKVKINTEREKKLNPNDYYLFEKYNVVDNGRKVKYVYLGDGVSFQHDEFEKMITEKTASVFTKSILKCIYTQEQLSRRACTDNVRNFTPRGINKRKKMTPEKNDVLKRSLRQYWKRHGVKLRSTLDERVSRLNSHISEEIKYAIQKERINIKKERTRDGEDIQNSEDDRSGDNNGTKRARERSQSRTEEERGEEERKKKKKKKRMENENDEA